MKAYLGTKAINAKPMTRGDYNTLRGWTVPADENPADEGYLVEYTDGGKPNLEGFAGYVSWSPKEQFDNAYREATGLNFGLAVEALKKGHRITRAGWNGKGMFLYYVPANSYPAQTDIAKKYWGNGQAAGDANSISPIMVPYGAYIAMKTAQENVVPWLASQTDVLADDWQIIEEIAPSVPEAA